MPSGIALAGSRIEVLQAHHERAVLRCVVEAGLDDVRVGYLKLDTDEVRHRREVAALHHLATLDEPTVPSALFAGIAADGHAHALVVSAIEGEPLTSSSSDSDWARAAGAFVAIHRQPPLRAEGRWSDQVAELVDYALGGERLGVERGAAVAAAAGLVSADRADLVHGDAQPDHVFLSADGVGLIDWGDVCVGDGAFDLAVLTLDDPARLDLVLGLLPVGERPSARTRIEAYWLIRLGTEIRWFDEHGFDPTPLLTRFDELVA